MRRAGFALIFCALAAPGLARSAEPAGYSLRSARIFAPDIEKTAKFYADAFGFKEIMRVDTPKKVIIMNFGLTRAEALASATPRIMVEQAEPAQHPDGMAHIVFNVPDPNEAVARVTRAGGSLAREPVATVRPDATRTVSYVKDPAGNLLELMNVR